MKKVLVSGMLLGLLTSVSYAQHAHAITMRAGAGVRIPNASPVSPIAGMNPSAISMGHDGMHPNAITTGTNPKPLTPNATTTKGPTATKDPTAKAVGPDADTVGSRTVTVPNRVITPDAHSGPGPNQ